MGITLIVEAPTSVPSAFVNIAHLPPRLPRGGGAGWSLRGLGRNTIDLDWQRYKELCDAPWTFSRWMLEQTLELARQQGWTVPELQRALEGVPLPKPAGHRGGRATDMFELTLGLARAQELHGLVSDAVRAGRVTAATAARGLGGFQAAWAEYVSHLERG